jgi:hypothetical protein
MLNPWYIEIEQSVPTNEPYFLRVNIINRDTGEIRQTPLAVEDIDAICTLGLERVKRYAEECDEGTETWLTIDKLLKIKEEFNAE